MRITEYAVKWRTAVFVFIGALTVMGVLSYRSLPREGFPDVTIPYVFVTAAYEGTAPAEMENLVTLHLEKQFNDLENVKEIRSTSAEGVSFVSVEFTPKQDIDAAPQRVKDKIDLARPDLPRDLDEPVVEVLNFSTDIPILTVALSGDVAPERLKLLADVFAERAEMIAGVKQAQVLGAREREIRVEVDPVRLSAYRLPVGEVIGAIARENRTVSAGNIEIAGGKVQVRVPGEFRLAAEIEAIAVAVREGRPVYLSDVASVTDTFKDVETITRINGRPCVSVQVKKRSAENSVRIIAEVKDLVARSDFPPEVAVTVTNDQSEFIISMVQELEDNIISGLVLVVLVLFAFLGWRNSLFVGLAIPTTMMITFVIMQFSGFTLNMMVLFSLVMSAGMVVDDAIVIVENSFRLRSQGLSALEAARRGVAEVAWPVTTSTITTLVAFWPLLLWPNVIGQFMSFLPKTVIIVLIASLFVALALSPAVCSLFIAVARPRRSRAESEAEHPFLDRYEAFLRAAIRHRGAVLLLGLMVLFVTVLLYARFGRGMELFPEIQPRSATVDVRFAQGTHIDTTDAALRAIERILPRHADIKFFLATAGAGGGALMPGAGGTPHAGTIYVEFLPSDKRGEDTRKLIERLRADMPVIPGAEIKVDREREGPPTGAPVTIEVSGEDFTELSELSAAIRRAIATVPGLVDLRDDFEEARPEFRIVVDRRRAALLGLDTAQIGDFLRTSVYGAESSKFRAGEDEYEITVRLPVTARDSAALLEQISIPTGRGGNVPLSSLGRLEYAGGRGTITRKDRKRVITISGDIQGRSIDAVLRDVRERVGRIRLPPAYAVSYTGEDREMKESGAFLLQALFIAVALIAVVLVIEFNSVLLPALVLVSVVLSMIGVLWGLLLCGMRFGVIMTGLGVISLAGVVVKNSIVLLDCTLQLRAEGYGAADAVVLAGRRRLRPVVLTAASTVLGLIPMAVGWSVSIHGWPPRFVAGAESSEWWAPMAVAVIFGLCVATLLTLVQIPVMYTMIESFADWARRAARRRGPRGTAD